MGHIAQRFGIRLGRGWVTLILLALAGVGLAYWVGPLRPPPAQLRLVVLDGDSAVEAVQLRGAFDEASQVLRYALPLAVQNVGERAGQPRRLVLDVPGRFSLSTPRGRLSGEVTAGVPLRRYVVDVPSPAVAPGGAPQALPGLETLFLEPDLPRFYCTQSGDAIPEFVPAPDYNAEALSEVRIFYSLVERQSAERSTGLLSLQLDPEQLRVQPAQMPPAFPTVFEDPEVQGPELGPLSYRGSRTAWCGDPEQPMELFSVSWEAQGGARFWVIHVQGQPRKHLYDLDGDGTVDLETWDVDGDGRFEARRQARFPVPEFLQPLPAQRPELTLPDTTPPDPAWLALFRNTAAGPFRFALEARAAVARGPVMPGDTTAEAGAAMAALDPLPPPDSAWLRLFLDASAGPFRFTRRVDVATPADTAVTDTLGGLPTGEPAADTAEAAPDTAQPPPRPRPAPRPLGTPVPPRRDTIPR